MKMQKRYLSIASILAFLSLETVSVAQFQEAIPDLACKIKVSKHKDGTIPIKNGGFSSGNSLSDTWVHVTVKNWGIKKAESFIVKTDISRNGQLVKDTQETFSLEPGKSHKFASVNVHSTEHSNSVNVTVRVDTTSIVKEKIETNNVCKFNYEVAVIG